MEQLEFEPALQHGVLAKTRNHTYVRLNKSTYSHIFDLLLYDLLYFLRSVNALLFKKPSNNIFKT